MQILKEGKNIDLLPKPNEVKFVLSDLLPPHELITSASAFAFEGDRLLLTQLKSRGWDLPGGHIEEGETPEEAVRREVYEESGAALAVIGNLNDE